MCICLLPFRLIKYPQFPHTQGRNVHSSKTYGGTVCMASLARQILPPNPDSAHLSFKFLSLPTAENKNKLQLSTIYQIVKTAMKRNGHGSNCLREIHNINIIL